MRDSFSFSFFSFLAGLKVTNIATILVLSSPAYPCFFQKAETAALLIKDKQKCLRRQGDEWKEFKLCGKIDLGLNSTCPYLCGLGQDTVSILGQLLNGIIHLRK